MITEIQYKRVNMMRDAWERKYEILFRKLLNGKFRSVARKITADNYTSDFTIDGRDIEKLFVNLYQVVGTDFAKDSYRTTKAQEDEELVDRWEQYMRDYARRKAGMHIVSITVFTKEQIRNIIGSVIDAATEEGLGAAETARLIRRELEAQGEAIARWRALMIARTEVATASNAGSLQGLRDLGVPVQKIWIATMDQRTRDTHAAMNNVAVDVNEPFIVGGVWPMDCPLDPDGPAEETINCRCTLAGKVKRYEGNYAI